MWFRHLDHAPDTALGELGPAAIDDLLDRGDLEAWAPLLRAVGRDPWGSIAETILRLCDAHPMYGTSALWRTWIARRRHREGALTSTLAEARSRAGLTQTQVAERLGISQSDVSKLERRADVRLSTLRAYASAIGFRLHVALQGPGDEAPGRLVTLEPRRDRRNRP